MKSAQPKQVTRQPNKPVAEPFRTSSLTTFIAGHQPIPKSKPKCPLCNKAHYLNQCANFLDLDTESRWTQARKLSFCTNCLSPRHKVMQCKSGMCRVCNLKHHTLLHTTNKGPEQPDEIPTNTSQPGTTVCAFSLVQENTPHQPQFTKDSRAVPQPKSDHEQLTYNQLSPTKPTIPNKAEPLSGIPAENCDKEISRRHNRVTGCELASW